MSRVPKALHRRIYAQANGCCEYCLVPDEYAHGPHEVDHIRALKHRGETIEDNLCLTCVACNRHKGTDLTSYDPDTDEIVRLYHPRQDRWEYHFVLVGAHIEGLTPIGRATTALLQLNTVERLSERELLISLGLYPTSPPAR